VFGVDAEDDGLLEAVAAFLEVVGNPLGDALGALSMTSVRSKSLTL
jgi:hypothetical protein